MHKILFTLLAGITFSAGIQAQTVTTDEDGCFDPYPGCVTVEASWKGDRLMTRYHNGCQGRVYLKACNETREKSWSGGDNWSCGAFGISRGSSNVWNTSGATGRHKHVFVGSTRGGNDWVCGSKVDDWDDL